MLRSPLPPSAVALGFGAGLLVHAIASRIPVSYFLDWLRSLVSGERSKPSHRPAIEQLVGNTPLIELGSLSRLTGCTILAKCEFLNPGGSVKDRVAKEIISEAEAQGKMHSGSTLYEGTAGSTGISLAMFCVTKGYACHVFMPDDQAKEKSDLLKSLGAHVSRVRPVSIVDPQQFCNLAKTAAHSNPDGFYADQFENLANTRAHFKGTGAEIWNQTHGRVNAFVCAAGTGGTIAGVSQYLKIRNPNIQIALIDPPGSSLFNKVQRGVLFALEEKEGRKSRHQVDSITEGIGINRLTSNFSAAKIDVAFRGSDLEAVNMAHWLLNKEGLFVGSSSAMNVVGAVKLARTMAPGSVIVTILCDSGHRHVSRFHNPEYLETKNLTPSKNLNDLSFIS